MLAVAPHHQIPGNFFPRPDANLLLGHIRLHLQLDDIPRVPCTPLHLMREDVGGDRLTGLLDAEP
ncbi:hypothetical protein WM25_14020 [Burkholderia ubonensis]|nr:hypothetical protein WM25_14020 [Burkholderia ubonensis]